jgi:predicted ATPase/DNA-binding CsgD family transcriptional regulator
MALRSACSATYTESGTTSGARSAVAEYDVPQRSLPPDMAVSAREAEVLAALAEHLTNAEIATRLFISVRTVESHVSSLLRKLQVGDRRALAAAAATLTSASGAGSAVRTSLPSPLTTFVGRTEERAALADALQARRLVTAIGPGGVGKTRLALAVAADVSDQFADGAWFVDLVPVTDPAMVAPAIAAALGLGEHQAQSAEDTVRGWLATRQTLLVLDNCEHLLDGVVAIVERLLASSAQLTVLATSRARLLVPFEWVFPVPGLSTDGDSHGDAVELFVQRAAAAGASPLTDRDRDRIAAICRALDGMALAIELAAARVPSLGVDGLQAGLADRLQLLTGGRRIGDRHRSLRSTLDWSYALLDEVDRAVLRRVSVFAAPFSADAAVAVFAGWPPMIAEAMPTILGRLAEQSLLVALADPGETRYRALETIRQYGADRLAEADEAVEARARHLGWCLDSAASLQLAAGRDDAAWRSAFDQVADDLRGALGWAAGRSGHSPAAHRLAIVLAELTFVRGLPGESQRRYEQAAELGGEDTAAAALHLAAGAAEARNFGDDAMRLHYAAADAALRAGDRPAAAIDLARAAELVYRAPGLMSTRPSLDDAQTLIAEARGLAAGDLTAEARLLAAEAYTYETDDSAAVEAVERALDHARRAHDPLAESEALDQLTAVQLARGQLRAATATAIRRTELMDSLPATAAVGLDYSDAFCMAAECAIAAGDLPLARRLAERVRDLPFHREEGHLASARLIVVTAIAGQLNETIPLAEQFREGWERAGSPRTGNLSRGAYAAATGYGLRGDDGARAAWLEIVDALATPGRPMSDIHAGEFFDALLLLHRGQAEDAVRLLQTPPEEFTAWYNGMWRPWYAALWAEAAVLTSHPDAADRIGRARQNAGGNPVAVAIVDRAAALTGMPGPGGGRDELLAVATALAEGGCRYQWARTLVMLGGAERARGEAALAEMGTTAMVWPPGSG